MITRGDVNAIRELSGKGGQRVQARVCLGSSTRLGSAIVVVESASPGVLKALKALKEALAEDALEITKAMVTEGAEWANDGKPHSDVSVAS